MLIPLLFSKRGNSTQVPFTPSSLSGMTLWLDASDGSTITKDGSDLVSQWRDKSGNTNHVNGTTTARPTWVVAQQNAQPIIRFDGAANQLTATNALNSLSTETVFVIAKVASSVSLSATASPLLGATSGNWVLRLRNNSGADVLEYAANSFTDGTGAIRNLPVLRDRYMIYSGRRSQVDNTIVLYENGVEMSSTTHTSGTYSSLTYRLGADAFGNRLASDMAEVVCFNRMLSVYEHAQMVEYLRAKWALFTTNAGLDACWRTVRRYAYANAITSTSGLAAALPLFYLCGQSNAVGRGANTSLPGGLTGSQSSRYIWNDTNKAWEVLNVGSNNGGQSSTQHGTEPSLMRDLQTYYGTNVYLLKYAVDGSNLNTQWKAGTGAYYLELLARRIRALDKIGLTGQRLDETGLVWYQGESDGDNSTNANAYQQNELDLFAAFRTLLGKSDLKIADIQVQSNSGSYPQIATVKAAKVTNATGYNTLIAQAAATGDGTHADSASLITQGEAAADIWTV